MQPPQRRVAEQGRAAPHPQLHEPRSGAHQDAERERADLGVKRPLITFPHPVELDPLVGDDAREHVEPADRAFRVGQRRHALFEREMFEQRHDIDAVLFEHRAPRSDRCGASTAIASLSATLARAPGRKLARTRYATSPSRRSMLAGWIWSSPIGSEAKTSPPPRTAARSICAGNSPVDRSPSAAGNAAPASASLMSPTTPPRRCPAKLTHGGRPANAAVTNHPRHHLTTRRQTGCFETAARCRDAACRRSGPAGAWRYTRSARSSRSCRRGFRRRPCPAPRSAPS